jgi:nucleoside-diphosphate-sugar epimerase
MRVIVTGAAGFVGRYTVAELLARGHAVTAVVRPGSALPHALERPAVEVVRADLRHASAALQGALLRADAVVHLAAGMSGTSRARFDATVLATERLLELMRELHWRGRLVHVSSLAVYGFNQLPRSIVLDEEAPLEPCLGRRDDYAWTKTWQERVVRRLAHEAGIETTIVRPGAIYGPERQFQQRLGRQLGSRGVLLIGGRNRLPLSYVENTASLLAECVVHPRAAGQTFNAIDPDPPRQCSYLARWRRCNGPSWVVPLPLALFRGLGAGYAALERITGGRISAPGIVDRYGTRANFGGHRFDGSKALRVLGWQPSVSRAQGFAATFDHNSGRRHGR